MGVTTFPVGSSEPTATVSTSQHGDGVTVFTLSMHHTSNGVGDNRLRPEFIATAMLPALDFVELEARKLGSGGRPGPTALVLTGETKAHKFFSNGLDLSCLAEYPTFFKDYYYKLMDRLLTFPIHTVAAINGHCFAGGLGLAICADWRVMKAERAWCCMNEIEFGAPLPPGMASVLSMRLSPATMTKMMLTAHRYTAPEALAVGMIDEVVPTKDGAEVVKFAQELAARHAPKSASGVVARMKEVIWSKTSADLKKDEAIEDMSDLNRDRFTTLQSLAATTAKL